MSEKMRLHVSGYRDGWVALVNDGSRVVAQAFRRDEAEYICAAVNAYDPDAVPATVSESQWIPLPTGALHVPSGAMWYACINQATGDWYVNYDNPSRRTLEGESLTSFLRYMARAMGDAFPAALKELLS